MEGYKITAISYSRGHRVLFSENNEWLYADDNSSAKIERPCIKCGLTPTPEGYDPCLGYIEGATSACCGHGVECGYVVKNGERIETE